MNIILFICIVVAARSIDEPVDVHRKIAQAALEQVGVTTIYAPGYVRIKYPNGDITQERGVCADVIVRHSVKLASISRRNCTWI